MSNEKRMHVRLAYRVEGHMWNCYLAYNETMEGAVLLSSIIMPSVLDKERKHAFMELMKSGFSAMAKEVLGVEAV